MIDVAKYPVQVRANARLVDAGVRQIEACPEQSRVDICVVLVELYGWNTDGVGDKQIPSNLVDKVELEILK